MSLTRRKNFIPHTAISPQDLNTEFDNVYNWLNEHISKVPIDHPDNSIPSSKFQDGAITSSKIADGSVPRSKIQDNIWLINRPVVVGRPRFLTSRTFNSYPYFYNVGYFYFPSSARSFHLAIFGTVSSAEYPVNFIFRAWYADAGSWHLACSEVDAFSVQEEISSFKLLWEDTLQPDAEAQGKVISLEFAQRTENLANVECILVPVIRIAEVV